MGNNKKPKAWFLGFRFFRQVASGILEKLQVQGAVLEQQKHPCTMERWKSAELGVVMKQRKFLIQRNTGIE